MEQTRNNYNHIIDLIESESPEFAATIMTTIVDMLLANGEEPQLLHKLVADRALIREINAIDLDGAN